MTRKEFDIFQTRQGYIAVTSPVRRTILDVLAKGPQDLGGLMKATGRSKPTLSNLHVKELLVQELIEEAVDPKDKRKKWYRLVGKRIGSSDVPVGQLRDAIKRYVDVSPLAARVSIPAAFDALLAAEANSVAALNVQAERLGAHFAPFFAAVDARDLVGDFARFLEREGIITIKRLDFEKGSLEASPGDKTPVSAPARHLATVIAGSLAGLAKARGVSVGRTSARVVKRTIIIRFVV